MKTTSAVTNNINYFGKKRLTSLLLLISAVSSSAYAAAINGGNYKLAHGWNYIGHADVTTSLTFAGMNNQPAACRDEGFYFFSYSGWYISGGGTLSSSSDGVANGPKSSQGDVLLVFRGGQVDGQNLNSSCTITTIPPATWNSAGQYSVSPKMSEWGNNWEGGITVPKGGDYYRWQKKGMTITSRVNTDVYIYVGPKAVVGNSYSLTETSLNMMEHGSNSSRTTITGAMNITIKNPRVCTVKTDNTITFPPVDITDTVNGKALANKTGDFTVTCDDATNAPVTVEIQGPKGRYTDTMALTMTDGSNAPAEIRGFIGSDIPLSGQCNGLLDGYPGIVYFVTNAGLEKMSIKPGAHKYNWVLCSKGEYKTGKATGSAKMIVSWD